MRNHPFKPKAMSNRKIVSYQILREWEIGPFESKIQKALTMGWEPYGSATVVANPWFIGWEELNRREEDGSLNLNDGGSISPLMWVQHIVKYED